MSEQNLKNKDLFNSLMNATLPYVAKSSGKFCLGIVNSRNNGKRMTISKSIADDLNLVDKVYAMPAEGDRKLVLCKTKIFPSAVELKITEEGKRTSYCAPFVEFLTKLFALDFSKHVSRTFYDVEFDTYENNPVAVVNFPEENSEEVA